VTSYTAVGAAAAAARRAIRSVARVPVR